MKLQLGCLALAYLSMVPSISAQTTGATVSTTTSAGQTAVQSVAPATQVPRLVKFSGTVQNFNADEAGGGAVAGNNAGAASTLVGMTFSLYAQQTGGVPLWSEVQNVQVDSTGHYTVQLGATKPEGLPVELFSSAEAQWLGVRQEGQAEQPRIMLLSVPYALKAADAETFGGKPPSAYMSAPDVAAGSTASGSGSNGPGPLLSGQGNAGYIAYWYNGILLADSLIFQTSGNVGIGTTTPFYVLTVKGNDSAPLLYVYQHGQGAGIDGIGPTIGVEGDTTGNGSSSAGVMGSSSGGDAVGVMGTSSGAGGSGVKGVAPGNSGTGSGAYGQGNSPDGFGVAGYNTATSGSAIAVYGQTQSPTGIGVEGQAPSGSQENAGVFGASSSTAGYGVTGQNLSTSGLATGVYGKTASTQGLGVTGEATATSGGATGVGGITDSLDGAGVYGIGVGYSNEGQQVTLRPLGVWGDTDQDEGVGVLATADAGIAFAGFNNADNISTGKFENDERINEEGNVFATLGGYFGGVCETDVSGDLGCSGTIGDATPVDGGTRKVALYAVQSPENWFEDFGSGQLANGVAVIPLEPVFAQTVNTGVDYHVFLTPNGDCKGLYVSNKTADSFEVHELGGGKAGVSFDYRIVARRKGYETVRLADKTKQFQDAVNGPKPKPGKVAHPTVTGLPAYATQADLTKNKK